MSQQKNPPGYVPLTIHEIGGDVTAAHTGKGSGDRMRMNKSKANGNGNSRSKNGTNGRGRAPSKGAQRNGRRK